VAAAQVQKNGHRHYTMGPPGSGNGLYFYTTLKEQTHNNYINNSCVR